MSYDFRQEVIGRLELVNINTPDGDFGFMVGTDGVFKDINGKLWYGSTLIQAGEQQYSYSGNAPAGELTLSFIQDPDQPDLINQIRELGNGYIKDRNITFFVQPITAMADFYNPTMPPQLVLTRTMKTLRFTAQGLQNRQISLTFETAWVDRKKGRRFVYNTADHSSAIGYFNPSLEFIPTVDFQEQKLFD